MATQITDTGIRGFLKWFQQQQPAIYKAIAPKLPKMVPQAFSGYMNGGWKYMHRVGLGQFDTTDTGTELDMLPEITVEGNYQDLTSMPDYTSTLTPISAGDNYATLGVPTVAIDTSSAANSGVTNTGVANAIASVVSAGSKAFLTVEQQNVQNQIVQTQLQRAAAGLPPLPTSLTALGVPQASISGTMSSGGMLLLLGGGLLLFAVMGSKKAA